MHTDATGYDTKYFFPSFTVFRDVDLSHRRKPAWTDRVLHQSSPFVPVNQSSYDSHPSITMSDHRPVSAVFLVDVSCVRQLPNFTRLFTLFIDSVY